MSWRVMAAVMIAAFALLLMMMTTAGPIRQVEESIVSVDDGGGVFDTADRASDWIRGYSNLFLILVFGLFGWGAWRVLRREVTRGRL